MKPTIDPQKSAIRNATAIPAYVQVTEALHKEMSEAGTGFADDAVERAYAVLNVHFARLREQPRAAKVFLLEITGL
ncbi:MAG TPA: hypothetical protein VII34_13750, partial [Pyrinomonadaceae bacterium]